MNKFNWCEKAGRELFEKVLNAANITNYEFSADNYAIWDAKYSTDKVDNIVEIKVRNQNWNTYPDWILEQKKYNALVAMTEVNQKETEKEVNALYINFFNDGYFCIWSIKNVDVSTAINKDCKAKTAVNSDYISKSIIPLKVKDAVMFGQLVNNQVIKLVYEET